jgi:hypothetical protein
MTAVSGTISESLTPTDWIVRTYRLDTGAWLADTAVDTTSSGSFSASCGSYAGPVVVTAHPKIDVRWTASMGVPVNSYAFPTDCAATPYFFKTTTEIVTDPYFSNVTFLAHCDGTNGSSTFTDVKGHTITAASGVSISTAQSKFGGASGVSTGAAGAELSVPTSADFGFGTGDFTIEVFIYYTSTPTGNAVIIDVRPDAGTFPLALLVTTSDLLGSYDGATLRTGGTLIKNAWNYISWTRSSNVNELRVGGVLGHTWTASQDFGSSRPLHFFSNAAASPTERFTGYIDEIRITKGVARNVTSVPTSAFSNRGGATTGSSEPVWNTTTGATTTDNEVTWICMGPLIQPITQAPLIPA